MSAGPDAGSPVLEVRGLAVCFGEGPDAVHAVDDAELVVSAGECVGLVGESGSGKSVTAHAVFGVLDKGGRVVAGRVSLEGRDLLGLPEVALDALRGRRMAFVPQEPAGALTPVRTVGDQLAEVVMVHEGRAADAAWRRGVEALASVGVPDAERRARQFPHELSGGLRQRAALALALVLDPVLLVADEPTTALDVTRQAQVLDLLRAQQAARGLAVLLITHDLGVVAECAQSVVVMYAGEVVERAPVAALFADARHPYTQGLLAARLRLDGPPGELRTILGGLPAATVRPAGCRFAPRCPHAMPRCAAEAPRLRALGPDRAVRCHLGDAS